jgi:hypothetical protein
VARKKRQLQRQDRERSAPGGAFTAAEEALDEDATPEGSADAASAPTEEPVAAGASRSVRAYDPDKGPSRRTVVRDDRRLRSQRKKARRRLFLGLGGGAIALALIIGLVLPSVGFLGSGGSQTGAANDGTVATGTAAGQSSLPSVGTQIDIAPGEGLIPTTGPSGAEALAWGVYETRQPDTRLVGNLEQGGIVLSYNLSDDTAVDELSEFVHGLPGYPACYVLQPHALVTEGSVTLSSWGWIENYSGVDRSGMESFIVDHRNNGDLFLDSICGFDAELSAQAGVDNGG